MNSTDAQDDAAETSALSVDVLGGGIHHAIGPQRQGPLEERRGKNIVDRQRRTRRMSDLGHARDVDHFEARVRGCFQQECLRRRRHGRAPFVEIRPVDEGAADPKTGQQVFDDEAAGSEKGAGRNHVVAGLDLSHHGGGDRSHPGRGGLAHLGAFERRHPLFEHGRGRIGISRIAVAGLLVEEPRFGAFGVIVDEPLRQEQRFRRFSKRAADLPVMHQAGFEAMVGCVALCHGGNLNVVL